MDRKIICAGSSITWTGGMLDGGFVGAVDDYIKSRLSRTVMGGDMCFAPTEPEVYFNPKQYKDNGWKIFGLGSAVEFELESDELVICQTVLRTADYAELAVYADGEKIGTFTNCNRTLGTGSDTFTGNGEQSVFGFGQLFTFNHKVTVDGRLLRGAVSTHDYGEKMAEDQDYIVIRRRNHENMMEHALMFAVPPADGAEIAVEFSVGETIAHTRCSLGEDNSGKLESVYGMGDIPYDPANPVLLSSGLDFRYINREAFLFFPLDGLRRRKFRIEITGGCNPYFVINFASDSYSELMNAGIGGWQLDAFMTDPNQRDYKTACSIFTPDVMFLEFATNDDWCYPERKVTRTITGIPEAELKAMWTLELHSARRAPDGTFTVVKNTALIDSADASGLVSDALKKADIVVGDIVRIGNYSGDLRTIAVREITGFDRDGSRISWDKPLSADEINCIESLDELSGAEFAVRTLTAYEEKYCRLIDDLRRINPEMVLFIVNPGASNYFTRQLWGYGIVHRRIAARYADCKVIDVTSRLVAFQDTQISGRDFVELQSDGCTAYELPWDGHHQGFRVIIDGQDVYGIDCCIEFGMGYVCAPDKTGDDLNFEGNYFRPLVITRNMCLKFVKNPPAAGKVIRVERADSNWSHDFCHPGDSGCVVYGNAYGEALAGLKD